MKTTAQLNNNRQGFTLIELLVVIGILAVLLAITLIAINPARQFQQARNTQRASDVNAILNAVHQFMADPVNDGTPPAGIPTDDGDPLTPLVGEAVTIGEDGTTTPPQVDLCVLVPEYIAAIPTDPQSTVDPLDEDACGDATDQATGYTIVQSANSRITVFAPTSTSDGAPEVISVTR